MGAYATLIPFSDLAPTVTRDDVDVGEVKVLPFPFVASPVSLVLVMKDGGSSTRLRCF